MGIKGIFGEIGPGERIALSKLAVEKIEQTSRPFRIAIDVSIWQFQIQAASGGSNPALRTFYYRLLKMMASSVQPLFVFDGPNKPPFKRNKRIGGRHGGSISDGLTKQLLKLFGFPYHQAPGEAEAECAYLQREGIVDAVLSEDVDTLMFGCGQTLRGWSGEGSKSKVTTHVSVYNAKATKEGKSGLDREGMILVALMSGGDYITEGIPGAGIKVACEAARAGYGRKLCQLSRSDEAGLNAWREDLAHELRTNESKYFKIKRKALTIPNNFPNREVIGYYTHPVVSTAAKIEKLRTDIPWDGPVDVQGLRQFVADTFDWTHRIGARKFIRGLAPALLIHKLRTRKDRRESHYGDITLTEMNELQLVRDICGERNHPSTDAQLEIRLIYHPLDITGINLDAEEDIDDTEDYGRDGLAPQNEEGEIETYMSDNPDTHSTASPSKRAPSQYDPTKLDRVWVLNTVAKLGIPLKVEDYEAKKRALKPKKASKAKTGTKKTAARGGMPRGALEKFVKVSKLGLQNEDSSSSKSSKQPLPPSSLEELPPAFLAPTLEGLDSPKSLPKPSRPSRSTRSSAPPNADANPPKRKPATSKSKSKALPTKKPAAGTNPFALAKPSPTSSTTIPITKPTKEQTQKPNSRSPSPPPFRDPQSIPSSPLTSLPSSSPHLSTPGKHRHPPSPPSSEDEISPIDLPDTVTISRRSKSKSHDIPGTPTRQSARPSPRKKISPNTSRMENTSSSPSLLTHTPVARKLSFLNLGQEQGERSRSRSSSLDLPTVQNLLGTKKPKHRSEIIDLSSSPESTPPRLKTQTKTNSAEEEVKEEKTRRKYIVLRDSLPGSWKEIDEDEMEMEKRGKGKGRRAGTVWAYSQIPLLDLSAD